MKVQVLAVAALVGAASAFVPPVAGVARVNSALRAYVPDGISPEAYAKMNAEKAAKAAANKKKFAEKGFEDLADWLVAREKKFPDQPGAGHTYAKVVDKEKVKPRASSFLN